MRLLLLLLVLLLLAPSASRPLSHCSSLHGPFCPLLNGRALPTHARALLGHHPSVPARAGGAQPPGAASAPAELARAVAAAIAAAASAPGATQRAFRFDFGDGVVVDVALVSSADNAAPVA